MGTDKKSAKSAGQFRALVGYLLACLASGVVIAIEIAIMDNISRTRPSSWNAGSFFGDAIALTLFTAPVVMTMTLLPVVLFVWWSEKRAERRFSVYAVASIAMAIAGSFVFFWPVKDTTFQQIALITILFIPAGFVAGATYWFVAGRRAGAAGLSHKSCRPS